MERIRSENIEKLQDPSYLEYKFLPELGLNDRHLHQYPSQLHAYCGVGIASWQYPNQFSHYLHFLSTQNIKSYAEIGCHKGGTFIVTVEYLSRFNEIESCLAVDNWHRTQMEEYSKLRSGVVYMSKSSQSEEFKGAIGSQRWDLALIDGDHSYSGAAQDFDAVRPHADLVAFHDIRNVLCPGTQQLWADIKDSYSTDRLYEWCEQYDEVLLRIRGSVMGLGLVDLRN